jgi:hypothetical protein
LIGENKKIPGLKRAIKEFVDLHQSWKIIEEYNNNNGLTVLEKING